MAILVDTNILVRLRDADSPDHAACVRCLHPDRIATSDLRICMQVLVEYWVVATRPKSANGIGLSVKDTDSDVADFLQLLPRIPEPTDIFERWRRLVSSHEVSGRPAHDARLVAIMQAHGLEEILTLNHRDFARFDGIRCLNPQVLS